MVGNCRSSGARLMVSLICGLALQGGAVRLGAKESRPPAQQGAAARSVGTVKTISGKSITLTTDAGGDISVLLQEDARILRVEPGQKDLKDAAPFSLQDLQPGDRVLVRGKMADDGNSLLAASQTAIKKRDFGKKEAPEREEGKKLGVGERESPVDPANGTIAITTTALGTSKNIAIHISKDTELRRYAPNSVKFDDAKSAPIGEIKAGDQLRARGSRSADGSELTADEAVPGAFRNIAAPVA